MVTGHLFEKVINGPAHHTLHHLYFTVNYGQVSALMPFIHLIEFLVVLYLGRSCRWLISSATVGAGSSAGCQGTRRQEGTLTKTQNYNLSSSLLVMLECMITVHIIITFLEKVFTAKMVI